MSRDWEPGVEGYRPGGTTSTDPNSKANKEWVNRFGSGINPGLGALSWASVIAFLLLHTELEIKFGLGWYKLGAALALEPEKWVSG